jgi:cutinase
MCQHCVVQARQISYFLGAAVLTTWLMLNTAVTIPLVSAESCPDIEVVFARGTGEAPGVGAVGTAFVDSLRSQVGGRSVGVYAVDYPASNDFPKAADGANDASRHVQDVAANCPNTRMVLGGFSQGALVMDLITAPGVSVDGFTPVPMPAGIADHVAAVAVFGNPSAKMGSGPLTAISPLYGAKTIDSCIPGDPICSPTAWNILLHGLYVESGTVQQAGAFAASRL